MTELAQHNIDKVLESNFKIKMSRRTVPLTRRVVIVSTLQKIIDNVIWNGSWKLLRGSYPDLEPVEWVFLQQTIKLLIMIKGAKACYFSFDGARRKILVSLHGTLKQIGTSFDSKLFVCMPKRTSN